jgi:DNA-directed RNA polymerase subunit F
MITETKELSMCEMLELLKSAECDEEKKKTINAFFKKQKKLNYEDAIKLREEIEKLDFLKVKGYHIAKIIDFLPEDASELNKIFSEESLNEDETNKLLEIIKKYK